MIGSAAHRDGRRSPAALRRALLAGCALTLAVMPAAVWGQSGLSELPLGRGLETDPNAQMLLEADELVYDFDRELVSAVGNVRVFYNGYRLETARITYHQASGRLIASGGVRIVEPGGNIITAEEADITDDFAEGFIQSLNVETVERTRFSAQSAERRDGEITVFRRGVYTACEPCEEDPARPPLWQVKASTIVHNQVEKTITYRDARLEFFGVPVAYFPYFQHPDPTVRRKTGFLVPSFKHREVLGFGVTTPFFWALAPNYDITLRPTYYTRQGLLADGEWRHRLMHGAYSIRLAGILQQDPDAFDTRTPEQQLRTPRKFPGEHEFRGSAASRGFFELSPMWSFGWDVFTSSDRTFGRDYVIEDDLIVPSTVYLTGMSTRNFYDMRGYHFTVQQLDTTEFDFKSIEGLTFFQEFSRSPDFSDRLAQEREKAAAEAGFVDTVRPNGKVVTAVQHARAALNNAPETVPPFLRDLLRRDLVTHDLQDEQAVVHPVIDHSYIFDRPVLGGELSIDSNITSLSRDESDLRVLPPVDYFNGVAGNFARASTMVSWRRSLIDSFGQEFTPFAYLDADFYWVDSADRRAGLHDQEIAGRAMPAVGLEYRWPFVAVSSWGVQTFSPVAQLIVRPNEQHVGDLPNEDAQSLVFDDSILFDWDKFSGWDRKEGGSRLNLGVTYLAHLASGINVDAIFGQSIHLFGTNSFSKGGVAMTGPDTGLETDRSDYVGRVTVDTGELLSFTARGQFDEEDLQVNRAEVSATASYGRTSAKVGYVMFGEKPARGILDDREEVTALATLGVTQNWSVLGKYVYDIDTRSGVQQAVGLAYDDECFNLSLAYAETSDRYSDLVTNRAVTLRVNLRTIGGTSYTRSVNGLSGNGEDSDQPGIVDRLLGNR